MRCLEILLNGKRLALIGHADAERTTAIVEATRGIDLAMVDLTAELPIRDGRETFASWAGASLAVGDELTVRVIDAPSSDQATIVARDIGQIESSSANQWPLCVTCGKPWHETRGMVSARGVYLCDTCVAEFATLRGK